MELMTFLLGKNQLRFLWAKIIEIQKSRAVELQVLSDGFGDPLELAQSYVEPDCQQFSPSDENEDDGPATVRTPLLSHISRHISDRRSNSMRHMFILSDAGMGKTSVLVMLKLAHLTSFWPAGYECVLLKLGDDTLHKIRSIKNSVNTVILLDALDEDPCATTGVERRLSELLKATQHFRRVVITCRTQFMFPERPVDPKRGTVEVSGFDCPVVYNSLFSEDQCLEYLERRSTQHLEDPGWLAKAQVVATRMGSLRLRPMLLAHIDDLIDESAEEWTEYEVYATLVRNWLKREQRKILDEGRLHPSVDELLLACRHVAINMHVQNLRYATASELHGLIGRTPAISHIEHMQLRGRTLLNRDSQNCYRFSHYSIQEYLVLSSVLEGSNSGAMYKAALRATSFIHKLFASWRSRAAPDDYLKASFYKLDLTGASFNDESLHRVNFRRVNLTKSSFRNVDATEANFHSCNLSGAKFYCTEVRGAHFDGADLSGVDLSELALDECTFFETSFDASTRWPAGFDAIAHGAVQKTADD